MLIWDEQFESFVIRAFNKNEKRKINASPFRSLSLSVFLVGKLFLSTFHKSFYNYISRIINEKDRSKCFLLHLLRLLIVRKWKKCDVIEIVWNRWNPFVSGWWQIHRSPHESLVKRAIVLLKFNSKICVSDQTSPDISLERSKAPRFCWDCIHSFDQNPLPSSFVLKTERNLTSENYRH